MYRHNGISETPYSGRDCKRDMLICVWTYFGKIRWKMGFNILVNKPILSVLTVTCSCFLVLTHPTPTAIKIQYKPIMDRLPSPHTPPQINCHSCIQNSITNHNYLCIFPLPIAVPQPLTQILHLHLHLAVNQCVSQIDPHMSKCK